MASKRQEIMDLYSDIFFTSPKVKSLEYQSRHQKEPIFFYILTQKPSISMSTLIGAKTGSAEEDFGVCHGDDLSFLFNPEREYKKLFGGENPVATNEDLETRERMVTMWTNFAKHSDPTPYHDDNLPAWTPYDPEKQAYMDIRPQPEVREGLFPTRMYFWQKMFWDDVEKEIGRSVPAQRFASTHATSRHHETRASQYCQFGPVFPQTCPYWNLEHWCHQKALSVNFKKLKTAQ